MVVAYQFIPRRKRTKSPALAALAPPPPAPRPLLTRIRTRCTTVLTAFSHKRHPSPEEGRTQQPGHRTLRSFHLTPERRRERESTRKTFAKALRLDLKIDIPAAFSHDRSPAASPCPPKRAYARMKEADDMCESLVKQSDASSWYPADDFYPRTPPPRFKASASPVTSPRSPPPLYPPPPAYVPTTPIRSGPMSSTADYTQRRTEAVDPFDDSAKIDDEGKEDSTSLMREIDEVIRLTMSDIRQRHEDPFVIEDGGDEETGSLSECSL